MNMASIQKDLENAITNLHRLLVILQPMNELIYKCDGNEDKFNTVLSDNEKFSEDELSKTLSLSDLVNHYIHDIYDGISEYKQRQKEFKERPLVITLCGSKKFEKTINLIYNSLTSRGILCFQPNFSFDFDFCNPNTIAFLHESHYWKMDNSDYIIIVDQTMTGHDNPYIGTDTQREIDYAIMKNQKIIKISDFDCTNYDVLMKKLELKFMEKEAADAIRRLKNIES